MKNKTSVFGSTGFIGSRYCDLYPEKVIKMHRDSEVPISQDVLYLISTVDNYNVFKNPFIDVETNLIKLMKVLTNCHNRDITFNFISSWFVYGSRQDLMTESDHCNPAGFYSITKNTAEQLLIEYCTVFNINYRILRLPNVVGSADPKTSDKKNVLQNTINLLKENQPITVYDNGTFTRDYMYIDDVCNAINTIVTKGKVNEIYNVGTGISTRFIDAVDQAKCYLNSTSEYIFTEGPEQYRHFQLQYCYLNISKLTNLGFTSTMSINQIIEKLCR